MRRAALPAAILALALFMAGPARAEPITDADAAAVRAGAKIDVECLKRDKVKDVGDCRMAATGSKQPDLLMLGFTFHMWFSDALLAELYRKQNGKAEIAALFENLANAEYPPLYVAERQLHLEVSDLCRMTEVDCATARRLNAQWLQRIGRKQP